MISQAGEIASRLIDSVRLSLSFMMIAVTSAIDRLDAKSRGRVGAMIPGGIDLAAARAKALSSRARELASIGGYLRGGGGEESFFLPSRSSVHRRFIARSFSPRGSPRYYVIPRERNRLLSAKSESTQTCHARRHSYSEETSSFSPFDGRNSAHFAGIFSLVDDDNQSRWRFH